MTEQQENSCTWKKFMTHYKIFRSCNMYSSHVCSFPILSASLYFQNCISCFYRDERTSFIECKQCSSTRLCMLLPWMHCRVPSSALIVKVSPGLTWTKKTCQKKNTFIALLSSKTKFPQTNNCVILTLEEIWGQGGKRLVCYICGCQQSPRAGRDLKHHLSFRSWNKDVTQLCAGENYGFGFHHQTLDSVFNLTKCW